MQSSSLVVKLYGIHVQLSMFVLALDDRTCSLLVVSVTTDVMVQKSRVELPYHDHMCTSSLTKQEVVQALLLFVVADAMLQHTILGLSLYTHRYA